MRELIKNTDNYNRNEYLLSLLNSGYECEEVIKYKKKHGIGEGLKHYCLDRDGFINVYNVIVCEKCGVEKPDYKFEDDSNICCFCEEKCNG